MARLDRLESPVTREVRRLDDKMGVCVAHIGENTSIMFSTRDIHALQGKLMSRGVRFSRKAEKAEWGGIQADFLDPDDNSYGLIQETP